MAAADAFAAKGASDIDARQMQATLRSLVEDAVKNTTMPSGTSPPASTPQAMLRCALARHGVPPNCPELLHDAMSAVIQQQPACVSHIVSTFAGLHCFATYAPAHRCKQVVQKPIFCPRGMPSTALAFAGEVAIDLQRVGNHCKDIAAELHKVKADIKDRNPPSTALQLKQRNAALSDQLQQTAARWVVPSHQLLGCIDAHGVDPCYAVSNCHHR